MFLQSRRDEMIIENGKLKYFFKLQRSETLLFTSSRFWIGNKENAFSIIISFLRNFLDFCTICTLFCIFSQKNFTIFHDFSMFFKELANTSCSNGGRKKEIIYYNNSTTSWLRKYFFKSLTINL
jgi:hypothetical protein